MTILVWLGWRLFQRGKAAPSGTVVWLGIGISALLFGVSHVPSVVAAVGSVPLTIVAYITLGNALFGLVAGILFWRYGLEAAIATTGGITAEMVQDLLLESLEYRFGQSERVPHPLEWLTDNGSCYIAKETRAFASSLGFVVCTTPVRSPQSNGMAEAFVKTFKRDYVYLNDLPDAATVMARLPEWIEDYNRSHPHKGLKMKSPWEYRAELASNE